MADTIPPKLKSLQLAPFAKRAAQLDKFKPIVTYWCESSTTRRRVLDHGR
jgi:vacuolar protein sorting-associated protein VTA1